MLVVLLGHTVSIAVMILVRVEGTLLVPRGGQQILLLQVDHEQVLGIVGGGGGVDVLTVAGHETVELVGEGLHGLIGDVELVNSGSGKCDPELIDSTFPDTRGIYCTKY